MQITLTPAGMAAANAASTSGLKIEIEKFRVYRSNIAEASLPYVTTGLEDETTLAAWTWLPNGVEFTTVEEFEPLDPDNVQFLCRLDETVGDFDFDILTLWLADGTFFGLAANPFLWKKRQAGNPPANQIKIHVSFTFTNAAAITAININNAKYSFDYIPEVNSVDELPVSELAPHRIYRVTRVVGVGSASASGVRSYLVQSGKAFFDPQTYQHNEWIPSDHRLVFQENLLPWVQNHASVSAFTNTTTRIVIQFATADTTDLGQITRLSPKTLLVSLFQSNAGLIRQVDSVATMTDGSGIWVAFSLTTALPSVVSLGDTVKIYTSQEDNQLISPSAANQVLRSKPQTIGFGQEWVTEVRPFEANCRLSANFTGTQLELTAVNGGLVVVGGTPFFITSPIILPIAAYLNNEVHFVYLYASGGTLLLEAGIGSINQPLKYSATGVAIKGGTDGTRLFVGTFFKNALLPNNLYFNMANLYVRSYYNDCGTISCGMNNSVFVEPGVINRGGRPYSIARLRASTGGHSAGVQFGFGGQNSDYPYNTATHQVNCIQPNSTDLVLGFLAWPSEMVNISSLLCTNSNLQGLNRIAIRDWNVNYLTLNRVNPNVAVTPAELQTQVLPMCKLQTEGDNSDQVGANRMSVPLSGIYNVDGLFDGDGFTPSFHIVDLVWEGVTANGLSNGERTQVSVQHSTLTRINSNL